MITIVCQKCGTAVRTYGDEAEVYALLGHGSDYYPDRYPCPIDGCGGNGTYTEAIDSAAAASLQIYELTPQEAFAAFNGLGMPPERDCGETAVTQALTGRVVSAGTRQVRGHNRTVLEWLQLDNGIRLYLAASADGAVVYRLAHRHSYVERANG